jgi:hypothetical protein
MLGLRGWKSRNYKSLIGKVGAVCPPFLRGKVSQFCTSPCVTTGLTLPTACATRAFIEKDPPEWPTCMETLGEIEAGIACNSDFFNRPLDWIAEIGIALTMLKND